MFEDKRSLEIISYDPYDKFYTEITVSKESGQSGSKVKVTSFEKPFETSQGSNDLFQDSQATHLLLQSPF